MYFTSPTLLAVRGGLLTAFLLCNLAVHAQYLGGIGDGSFSAGAVSAVAPLDLLHFTAQEEGPVTDLRWETANEEDTDYFEIQRATSAAGPFTVIGRVDAAGYSRPGEVLAYRFSDEAPPAGRGFYRLRTVDLDGSSQYGKLASATHETGAAGFEIFPNPGDGKALQLRLSEIPADRALQVEILDATGRRQIANRTVNVRGDVAALTFANRLPAGSYLVRLHTGQGALPVRLLIVTE